MREKILTLGKWLTVGKNANYREKCLLPNWEKMLIVVKKQQPGTKQLWQK